MKIDPAKYRRFYQFKPEMTSEYLVLGLKLLRPRYGWLATALLALNVAIVAWSVDRADWVDTPSLGILIITSMAIGFAIIKTRVPAIIGFPAGTLLGAWIIVSKLSSANSDHISAANYQELWYRLTLWYQAANDGTINIDQLPFAVGLMAITWMLGHTAAWAFVKYEKFWAVFAIGGAALLCNLTFLPDKASIDLGIYLLCSLILIGRLQSVRRRRQWDNLGLRYDTHLGLLALSDTLLLGFIILILAFLLPIGQYWPPARDTYENLRSPMLYFEEDFNRLFAGLPARREMAYRLWGDVMAFQGTINPTDTLAFQAESPVPMYWKARTYNQYTSKGWLSNETLVRPNNWTPSYNSSIQYGKQLEVTSRITAGYDSKILLFGGQAVSIDTDYLIETYDSPVYTIKLGAPTEAISPIKPHPEIDESFADLKTIIASSDKPLSNEFIADQLPDTLKITNFDNKNGEISVMESLSRWPDTLSVRSMNGDFEKGDTYELTSSISIADPDDLRRDSSNYPFWASTIYTQLPDDLPDRISILSQDITKNETSNYDKAVAIEQHLKTLEYSLSIDPPPFDSDGVDHFLFDQQKGYSEYFASAMTVMLRSIGIPARFVTGYSEGQKITGEDIYILNDSDAHGWVEVFFPTYGWIPFEPTPGVSIPPITYSIPEPVEKPASNISGQLLFGCEDDDEDCEEGGGNNKTIGPSADPQSFLNRLWDIPPAVLIVIGGLLVSTLSIIVLWAKYIASRGEPNVTYKNMRLLGRIAGARPERYQTPYEYQKYLEESLRTPTTYISTITNAYVQTMYSQHKLERSQIDELIQAWRKLRFLLILNILKIDKGTAHE